MGSRGAFVNINNEDYRFVSGGQIYNNIGFDESSNVKYLVQSSGSIKVPDYSHTANRIYAIFDNKGNNKSIGIYENHIKVKSIDFGTYSLWAYAWQNSYGTLSYWYIS